jgi:hypothetical protein
MMIRTLIFVKHNLKPIWDVIEWGNSVTFSALFNKKLKRILLLVFSEFKLAPFCFRKLLVSDAESLFELIKAQEASDLKYFNPHAFDIKSISKQLKKSSFLMMGVFDNERMVGYFFLRFFVNRRCFVGRLIDKDYRSIGIGQVMNAIMYGTGWRMGFRCLSTISRNNKAVIRAHAKNNSMVVLRELEDDYMLVEFIDKA